VVFLRENNRIYRKKLYISVLPGKKKIFRNVEATTSIPIQKSYLHSAATAIVRAHRQHTVPDAAYCYRCCSSVAWFVYGETAILCRNDCAASQTRVGSTNSVLDVCL